MKIFSYILNILILLYFTKLTKEDICSFNEISISGLGKCLDIEDILFNEDLTLSTKNLLYLASNNEGKIEKNGYKLEIFKLNDTKLQSHNMKKSKLYIPESCMKKMENHQNINLNRKEGIVILVDDSNNRNKNNISDKYFIIRHNSENAQINHINSKKFDFSFCNEEPILFEDEEYIYNLHYINQENTTLDNKTILYGRKYGIDLFDPNSDFFNDICFKFTSEKKTDVTLESRVEDYYQNITFCNDSESAHYLGYNYSEAKETISYRCAYGYYKNEQNKSSYLDKIDSELKSMVSVSNIKVITCYKQFLNLRDIVHNFGGGICILVLIIQIICFLVFCFLGNRNIKKQLNVLFTQGKEIIVRRRSERLSKAINNINIEKEIPINNQENNEQNSNDKVINNESNPPKKTNTENIDNEIKTNNEKEKNENKEQKINIDEKNLNKKIVDNKISSSIIKKAEDERDKETDFDKISNESNTSQLYEYEIDELNELPYEKAIKYDKRSFCRYYCDILIISHIILNIFFRQNDYNIFVVKLGLLFMTFPINLTFNIFFFTNKSIKLTYIKSMKDISNVWNNIATSVYSSILSTTLLIILKFICLTHNSIRELRKEKNVKLAEKKSHCKLRCIIIRLILYYFLSFVFLIVFGFYVLSFCAIFENTQIILVRSTFTSWLISLVYPFIICFVTSLVRSLSFNCQCKCLYKLKQLLQLL
jgi:hypothetical protein